MDQSRTSTKASSEDGKASSSCTDKKSKPGAEPKSVAKSMKETVAQCQSSDKAANEWDARQKQQEALERTDRFTRSGVPKRHAHLAIARPKESPKLWLEAEAKIVGRVGKGFVIALVGPRGTGKTQLATNAILESVYQGRSGRYMKALDLFVEIRGTYSPDSAVQERDAIDKLIAPRLLVIDELQNRGNSAWEDSVLTNLVDRRYDAGNLDTLLIANLKPDAFRETAGESIMDRMRETGGCIECNWASFRGGSL